MRLHNDRLREVSVSKNLDRQRLALDQSDIDQGLWRDGTGHDHVTQAFQVDDLVLLTKYVCEAMLRHATDQGHLAAFKPARLATPTAGSG